MSRKKNWPGILVTEQVYSNYASKLERKLFFNPSHDNAKTVERLWFLLGNEDIIIVCKDSKCFPYKKFIESGLLLDLRGNEFVSIQHLNSYINEMIFSNSIRIRECNMIREKLADSLTNFRWCGPELESILNKRLIRKASYMSGLYTRGLWWNACGIKNNDIILPSANEFITGLYEVANSMSERGQSKLFTLFAGFVMTRDIIYIGSSPGEGWMRAFEMMGCRNMVYCFDPRPLDKRAERISKNIRYFPKKVLKPSDVWDEIQPGLYDLIFDVRGETFELYKKDPKLVNELIQNEINMLNEFLLDHRTQKSVVRCNLKIKLDMIAGYQLPRGVRFFLLPFCETRDLLINEVRAVAKLTGELIGMDKIDFVKMRDSLSVGSYSNITSNLDYMLFFNSFLMRLDYENFIKVPPKPDVKLDVCLYAINRNPNGEVKEYLDMLADKGIGIICSFFTKSSCQEDEYEINEMDIVRRGYMIFDSRALIQCKLPALYFFIDVLDLHCYLNELVYGDTFMIKYADTLIRAACDIEKYNEVRDESAMAMGCKFLKFPRPYSVIDHLISPSGHAAKAVILSKRSTGFSLGMFMFKIISNFYVKKRKWVRLKSEKITNYKGLKLFNPTDVYSGEVKEPRLWHSLDEWISGIDSGYKFLDLPNTNEEASVLQSVIVKNEGIKGAEMREFWNKSGLFETTTVTFDKLLSVGEAAILQVEIDREEKFFDDVVTRDIVSEVFARRPSTDILILIRLIRIDETIRRRILILTVMGYLIPTKKWQLESSVIVNTELIRESNHLNSTARIEMSLEYYASVIASVQDKVAWIIAFAWIVLFPYREMVYRHNFNREIYAFSDEECLILDDFFMKEPSLHIDFIRARLGEKIHHLYIK